MCKANQEKARELTQLLLNLYEKEARQNLENDPAYAEILPNILRELDTTIHIYQEQIYKLFGN